MISPSSSNPSRAGQGTRRSSPPPSQTAATPHISSSHSPSSSASSTGATRISARRAPASGAGAPPDDQNFCRLSSTAANAATLMPLTPCLDSIQCSTAVAATSTSAIASNDSAAPVARASHCVKRVRVTRIVSRALPPSGASTPRVHPIANHSQPSQATTPASTAHMAQRCPQPAPAMTGPATNARIDERVSSPAPQRPLAEAPARVGSSVHQ